MTKVKFLINSTLQNQPILSRLIHSLHKNHILPEDILVVFGNSSHIYIQKNPDYYELGVTHNSIDFTALIAVIEHVYSLVDHGFSLPDYWFYLHDTCEVGETFYQKLFTCTHSFTNDVKPLTYKKSMNIGLYKYLFLLNHKDRILKMRSSNHPRQEEVQHWKRAGVSYEDFIFHISSSSFSYSFIPSSQPHDRTSVSAPSIIYPNSSVLRITEYFQELDFYKYKANWELKEQYILDP
jgi:hypothetical protein